MEIKENKKFAKATIKDVIWHKIKWVFKLIWYCINRPIEILLKWT